MPVITDIKDEIDDLTTFRRIAQAFTEASAVKLKHIREQFEKNTEFYEEINYVYKLVEISAKKMKAKIEKQEPKAPKILSVALTSNARFFGGLNTEIMRMFLEKTKTDKSHKLVIGSTGADFLRSLKYKGDIETMAFPKDNLKLEEINRILEIADRYDKVLVYFPKFISFLKQTVGVTDITQRTIAEGSKIDKELHIIFEPELGKMAKFFDNQVRLLLFRRVLLEAELSRTAARLLTMSNAEEKTIEMVRSKRAELDKIMKSIANIHLLETFSGMKKWKH